MSDHISRLHEEALERQRQLARREVIEERRRRQLAKDTARLHADAVRDQDGAARLVEARMTASDLQPRTVVAADMVAWRPEQEESHDGGTYAMLSRSACPVVRLHAHGLISLGGLRASRRFARLADARFRSLRMTSGIYEGPRGHDNDGDDRDEAWIEKQQAIRAAYEEAEFVLNRFERVCLDNVVRFGDSASAAVKSLYPRVDRPERLQFMAEALLISACDSLAKLWGYVEPAKA